MDSGFTVCRALADHDAPLSLALSFFYCLRVGKLSLALTVLSLRFFSSISRWNFLISHGSWDIGSVPRLVNEALRCAIWAHLDHTSFALPFW
ncbi:hypothetical protein CY34DRAFT_809550 [Suillus luteus UH-Slu-Lm8-n1]|uniref:Uncharacterized protein n=1 Tax=Suillus luteus UH-Slu-Lm8-n1 TaxID=930992 RepID=A0A0D0A928_9AGAM|nr:hypothetical protein CY34DRAFT_809550 [Suillus luteus UH-Slu-Lm8-n1]